MPIPYATTTPRTPFSARTDFFGRERETGDLLELLARPDLACLTITGPGGVGKTRLAQQVMAELAQQPGEPFPDGMWFVPLATIQDPTQAPAAILSALGLEPTDDDPRSALIGFLREREALLVLDNVEQIIDIAGLVAEIANECRDVKTLVTSRRPLRILGEQEYTLAPLPLPQPGTDVPPDALRDNPAVALFVQRAGMVNPAIAFDDRAIVTIAEMCRGLDGLPLAIELAASRVKALSPAVLANQLGNRLRVLVGGPRDAPARQQTLRAAIAWSYDILAPWEQQLFRRLAIFSGGFSLSLVEQFVALARETESSFDEDVLETIAALVDHSLLRASDDALDDPRWSMLETIREFGVDQLAAMGLESHYRRLHAETMARIADQVEDGMYGADQSRWIERIAADDGNFRAAIAWAMAQGDRALALRITGPLWRYWSLRHQGNDGRVFITKALAMPGEAPLPILGTALRGAGCLFEDISDHAHSERYHREALAVWREVGDTRRIARSLDDLGNVAHEQGRFDEAERLHAEAHALARKHGHDRVAASSLSNLGSTAYLRGDIETARARWQEVIESGIVHDPISRTVIMNNLGVAYMLLGNLEQAARYLTAALAIHREIGMPPNAADVLINLSDVAGRQGRPQQAKEYFEAAGEIYHRIDDPKGLHNITFSIGAEEAKHGNWPEALAAFQSSLRYADRANNLLGYADAIERIVAIAAETDRLADAAPLWFAARALRERIGAQELAEQGFVNAETERRLRETLDAGARARAKAAGEELQPRQAYARALAFADEVAQHARTRKQPRTSAPSSSAAPEAAFKLTKRETEVLRLLSEGKTDRDIAAALFISPRTAGTHVANILNKLDADTRTAAVALAFRHNIL